MIDNIRSTTITGTGLRHSFNMVVVVRALRSDGCRELCEK